LIEFEDKNEYIEVYNNVVILSSNTNKFKINDFIEQISVIINITDNNISFRIFFEHFDGTPY
jgi:hypothetical protein